MRGSDHISRYSNEFVEWIIDSNLVLLNTTVPTYRSSAETLAICQALDDLVESNVNLLVLSDSLSVLSALQNFSIKSNKLLPLDYEKNREFFSHIFILLFKLWVMKNEQKSILVPGLPTPGRNSNPLHLLKDEERKTDEECHDHLLKQWGRPTEKERAEFVPVPSKKQKNKLHSPTKDDSSAKKPRTSVENKYEALKLEEPTTVQE
ncbi:hypothetical protein TNCV_2689111 [Trichonephila clavipes]|nr:hypothetical protein TNCV_2689111 [Trichonephila clavipes]